MFCILSLEHYDGFFSLENKLDSTFSAMFEDAQWMGFYLMGALFGMCGGLSTVCSMDCLIHTLALWGSQAGQHDPVSTSVTLGPAEVRYIRRALVTLAPCGQALIHELGL